MNKWIYRFFMVFGGMLGAIFVSWGSTDSKVTELLAAAPIPVFCASIAGAVFIYKMWDAIDDGQSRTGGAKALLLLLIPLFNIYWAFNIFPGFATDYQRYVERNRVQAPPVSWTLMLCSILLAWIPVVGWVLQWMMVGQVCDGVTAIKNARAGGGPGFGAQPQPGAPGGFGAPQGPYNGPYGPQPTFGQPPPQGPGGWPPR